MSEGGDDDGRKRKRKQGGKIRIKEKKKNSCQGFNFEKDAAEL